MLFCTDKGDIGLCIMSSFKMHEYCDCVEKKAEASWCV